MEYRKHWLINSLGQRYDFTNKDFRVFLNEPQGFGFQRNYSSIRIGNSELVTSQQISMLDISGELIFYQGSIGEMYQAYQDFIQFCKYTPLEFHYQIPNGDASYHCNVIFTQANKTEVTHSDHLLHVPITMHRLTEWLVDDAVVISMGNDDLGSGKSYDLIRDYQYSGSTLSNITINNNGTDDVGFILVIEGGAVVNPRFTISQDGIVYGCCGFNKTCDYLLLNSIDTEESIYMKNGSSTLANPEQYQDFTLHSTYPNAMLTWCKLKVGESIFSFTCGNISQADSGKAKFNGTLSLIFNPSYISV